MPELFKLEVHTPYRRFFSGEVEQFTLTLSDGEAGVMAHHSFFTSPVLSGALKIKGRDGVWKTAFIAEGILEVKGHNTILMVNAAEWPGEIDRGRALAAMKRAQDTINASTFKFESGGAEAELRRAQYRIRIKDEADAPAK